ncbi:KpsF/GutQ family sugar-phosphate isomerase [Clostridium thermarum]|uniref:KpsF/GutQ family sugar-phosphate isomerase n=1 Tax=Clostridium thermarum TaxID=1716543 RepID=UPI0013D8534E|nr:KpsF/GutQ family sugar-phosphate isomerase [Clostridium thermarum]
MDILTEAKKVFDTEILALKKTRDALDDIFAEIINIITSCEGKIIITGIGKPGHIGKKLAATLSSLGTPSFYLHPAEALHGDLGMISDKDVVIAISYSGESDEITRIIPNIKMIGAKLIAISGNQNSTLVRHSDIAQILPRFDEACYLGLAPTSSTTATLCYGDALAVVASRVYGFKETDFGKYHPAGSLGKKLILKVDDLMVKGDAIPMISKGSLLTEAIIEIGKKGLGVVSIVDNDGYLFGILTDGDIRRIIAKKIDVYSVDVDSVMTTTPKYVSKEILAIDALKFMQKYSLNCLPVVDDKKRINGTITLQMIVKAGIIL